MFSFSVIKDFNVFKERRQGVLGPLESLMVYQFRFEDAEKGFGHCVIPAITLATHALKKMMLFHGLAKILACVLHPAIRMDDQPGARTAVADAAIKSCKNHLGTQRTAQCPTNDHSREQVQKDRQVQPAAFCGNIGDILIPSGWDHWP